MCYIETPDHARRFMFLAKLHRHEGYDMSVTVVPNGIQIEMGDDVYLIPKNRITDPLVITLQNKATMVALALMHVLRRSADATQAD
jgi:hypothetical protein